MFLLFSVVCLSVTPLLSALDNGLAHFPPRGWRSGERFGCNVNCNQDYENCLQDDLFFDIADGIVSAGLVIGDNGFNYIIVDDCWSSFNRTKNGSLQTDFRFYNMKYFAERIHDKGFKLGIFADIGSKTCNGYPGSKFHMKQDADTFAFWGVDMVFLDSCNSTMEEIEEGYPAMVQYLNQTGRPMLVSCAWPKYEVLNGKTPDYKKISTHCNTWQNFRDIHDSWESIKGVLEFYGDNNGLFLDMSGPGGWSNPGSLVIGDYGLSYEQMRSTMALWTMVAGPMFLSNDMRKLPQTAKTLLQNSFLQLIHQDPLGRPGKRIKKVRRNLILLI